MFGLDILLGTKNIWHGTAVTIFVMIYKKVKKLFSLESSTICDHFIIVGF